MLNKIWSEAFTLKQETISLRRTFHKYAETAWTEYHTAGIVVKQLQNLGFEVLYGSDALIEEDMAGLPAADILRACEERALAEGSDQEILKKMCGGKTGVFATMKFAHPGATVALRFDMDANNLAETTTNEHTPNQQGFSSIHKDTMHACGHDAHIAIGLSVAKLLAKHKKDLSGTIKLIFQPAEEGICGAKAMLNTGIVDDVDWFIGTHIGTNAKQEQFVIMAQNFLATTNFDALFTGIPSHAGISPEQGRNALLAAASATMALNAIPRHSKGISRINVGMLNAGTARNIIPEKALLQLETRGQTTEINDFMAQEALRILNAAAQMYSVKLEITQTGSAPSCPADPQMAEEALKVIHKYCKFAEIIETASLGGSEDCTYFMHRVKQNKGHAIYTLVGTKIAAPHHNDCFDIDEESLPKAVAALTCLGMHFLGKTNP